MGQGFLDYICGRRAQFSGVAAVGACLLMTPAAVAQAIPGGVEPGSIERDFDELSGPKSTQKIIIPAPSAEAAPENAAQIRFRLKDLQVDGSSVYGASALRPLYERFLGQEITLATVFAIANDITRMYADDGYALAIGFVPAQEIEDGTVRLAVAEGYVADVEIRGSGRYPARLLGRYSEKIKASRPLRTEVLERYLLLANDLSGLDVRGMFERGDTGTGATRLILDVTQKTLSGGVSYNNRGSQAIGRDRTGMSLGLNSLMRRGGRISANRIMAEDSEELIYKALSLSMPVGSEGKVVSLNIVKTDSEPGTELLKTLEFASDGTTGTLALDIPFIRSRASNFTANISFDYKDLESDILGVPNSEDKLRVLRAGGSYDFLDSKNGTTQFSFMLSHGLDVLDATSNESETKSRADGLIDFISTRFDIYRIQRMGSRVNLVTQLTGQHSFDPLLSSEQCGYGGGRYGRGYDSFEISGDHCALASVELQRGVNTRHEKIDSVQMFAFYDYGKVWQKGDVLPGELEDESASSIGLGLRIGIADRLTGSVEYAKPLDGDVALEGNDDGRVFFSLNARF